MTEMLAAGMARVSARSFSTALLALAGFGGLGDFDFQGVAEEAGDLSAAGVGDDFDVEEEELAAGFEIHGWSEGSPEGDR